MISTLIKSFSAYFQSLLLFTTIAGFVLSSLHLIYGVKADTKILKRAFNAGTTPRDKHFYDSGIAKTANWLTWNELVFFYFSGFFIILLTQEDAVHTLAFINILIIPYTFWSLYHQYKYKIQSLFFYGIQLILWFQTLIIISIKANIE